MTVRRILLLVVAVLLSGATASEAQTRFSLSGGVLVPLSKFDDYVDASARFGLRAEFQAVNAIGRKSRLSYFLQTHYSVLSLDENYKKFLEARGESTDAYMVDVGAGIRVYSNLSLFFITAGGGWVRVELGPSGTDDGGDVFGGAGFTVPLWLFMAEGQVTAHNAWIGSDDLQYVNGMVSLAMPF